MPRTKQNHPKNLKASHFAEVLKSTLSCGVLWEVLDGSHRLVNTGLRHCLCCGCEALSGSGIEQGGLSHTYPKSHSPRSGTHPPHARVEPVSRVPELRPVAFPSPTAGPEDRPRSGLGQTRFSPGQAHIPVPSLILQGDGDPTPCEPGFTSNRLHPVLTLNTSRNIIISCGRRLFPRAEFADRNERVNAAQTGNAPVHVLSCSCGQTAPGRRETLLLLKIWLGLFNGRGKSLGLALTALLIWAEGGPQAP
ncbi:hypothetical protein SKAU_G00405260 [Synaphobranchus kaupii]|uniref:Uncharacterized protein n=1 Tax=Synaphobranchus kaupii TaxID=118154 RepID=A0A9Q1E9U0_SYNKA|nr:hypothetical protein SKAU_G00405260 [Synaphobranchus kaupii]